LQTRSSHKQPGLSPSTRIHLHEPSYKIATASS
jgi:hypothetical protein